jgi:hypothetical protein
MNAVDTQRAYSVQDWRDAAEAAEEWQQCPIDTEENTPGTPGRLGAWLCNEVYGNEVVSEGDNAEEPTEGIIWGAIGALDDIGFKDFSPATLLTVLSTYRGETTDDWRALAEEYANENTIELVFLGGEPSEDDYHKWYAENGIAEGEVCAPTQPGGTLVWFNRGNKW